MNILLQLTASNSFARGLLHGEIAANIKKILEEVSVSTEIQTQISNALLRYQTKLLHEFEPTNIITDGRRVVMLRSQNNNLRSEIQELRALIIRAGTLSTVFFQSIYNKL